MLDDYTAEDLVEQVYEEGFWWAEDDDELRTVSLVPAENPGMVGEASVIRVNHAGEVVRLSAFHLRKAARAFCNNFPGSRVTRDLMNDDLDAEGSGVLAQQAIFGEVIYG